LIRSASRVTTVPANVYSVFKLFFFLVVCSDTILKGFCLVTFFASVKTSFVCIYLSCLLCVQSVIQGVRSLLFCGHKGSSLPEVSVTSFLPLQFFISVRLSESSFLTQIQLYSYCVRKPLFFIRLISWIFQKNHGGFPLKYEINLFILKTD
jgi:hypothetical protein